jgi:lipid A ethanolaminephosphotransferase
MPKGAWETAPTIPAVLNPSPAAERPPRLTLTVSIELTLLVTSVFWALTVNRSFFASALQGHPTGSSSAPFVLALGLALVALHFLLLAPLATRWTVKPLLAVLLVATAFASYFMAQLGVYMDPSMLRNVMRTDVNEARELFGWAMLPHLLLYAVLPLLLLWRVRLVRRRSWWRAVGVRLGAMLLATLLLVAAVMSIFQPLASLMRNHKELRYLVTPANYLWSLAAVARTDARAAAGPKKPIGLDAKPGARTAVRTKPLLVVLVVGETARAANWGLNGYSRNTTPELAALPVISFAQTTSCGTNTETSLPCMFAPVGRRDYDEDSIRGSESLLQVLARAGVGVRWRDNQSGCKGVCDGLPADSVAGLNPPGLCAEGRCLDEGLLSGLDQQLAQARGTQFLVLHQLGNHGPSYFRRYPPAFARFQPACNNDDLRQCTQKQIVNAYDNALLYTDHVLALLIAQLQARAAQVDSAVLYVSDHGESLGENNLYLHGLPFAIAPDVQKRVPMLMWLSPGFAAAAGIDPACLQQRATLPAQHDHLFHTLLALLDVKTALYDAGWDLTRDCRTPSK